MYSVQYKKSMIVSNNKIKADTLCKFFKTIGKDSVEATKKLATTAMKKSRRAIEIGAKLEVQLYPRIPNQFYLVLVV